MNTDLVTYHGKHELKSAFLVEIGKHEAADQIVKGSYGKMNGQWHGCAIGCSLRSLNLLSGQPHDARTGEHARIPTELGWPLWLAYLEDNVFERLPDDLAHTWPRRLAEAIPVGVTVPDIVLAKLLRWTLIDDHCGVVHAAEEESVKAVIRSMGGLFDRTISGQTVPEAEWDETANAARTAWAIWAAWAAKAARAAWAAWVAGAAGAAWSAGAARVVKDVWDVRDAWAAGDAFYPALSEEVLRLLRELDT